MHVKVNRILSTIALVLGIVIMGAVVVFGIALAAQANEVGDAINEIGTDETVTPDFYEDPLPYDAPLPEEGEYIGETYEDGTPCEGYGCTPEQDEELLEAETEAND